MNVDFRDRVVIVHGRPDLGGDIWIKFDDIVAVIVYEQPAAIGTVTLRSGAQINLTREACMLLIEQLEVGREQVYPQGKVP